MSAARASTATATDQQATDTPGGEPTMTRTTKPRKAAAVEAPSSDDLDKRLLKARRRTRTYDMPVEDPTAAFEKIEEALAAVRRTRALGDQPGEDAAQQKLTAAREELATCFVKITLEAVGARTFTDLVRAHPPTEAGQEWNPETFPPALIAACARDYDLTGEQWAEKFEDEAWSLAERNAITAAALDVNLGSSNERYQQVMAATSHLLR